MALRALRAEATSALPAAVPLRVLRASAAAQAVKRLRVLRAAASTPMPPHCDAGAAQDNLEPFQTVILTGGSDDSPSAWSWRQVSGPTVTLNGASSQTATYEAPCTIDGATLTFGLIVTVDEVDSQEATVTHKVLYATEVMNVGGTLRPYVPYICIDDGT